MALNCKKGDLAVCNKVGVTNGSVDDLGKITTCLELLPIGAKIMGYISVEKGRIWKTDREFTWYFQELTKEKIMLPYCPDHRLTPINNIGDDEEDEMLLIAGNPNEVTAL